MVCKCGYQNQSDAVYCAKCGKKLERNRKITILSIALAVSVIALIISLVGDSHDHNWTSATCTSPKICATCGETSGSATGHSWKAATCTYPKTCVTCGATTGSASGHIWEAATYDAPKTCSACGITEGTKLQRPVATQPAPTEEAVETIDAWLERVTIQDGYSEVSVTALVFDRKLTKCKEMTIHMDVSMNYGTSCKDWHVWGRIGGKFEKIGKIYLPDGNGSVSQKIEFPAPKTFDAICITPTIPGGYSWSMEFTVTDIDLA